MLEHPQIIFQYMDCKSGLIKLKKDVYKPSHTMSTGMDLVLAYKTGQGVKTHNSPEIGAWT